MAGPWEKYQAVETGKPWEKYQPVVPPDPSRQAAGPWPPTAKPTTPEKPPGHPVPEWLRIGEEYVGAPAAGALAAGAVAPFAAIPTLMVPAPVGPALTANIEAGTFAAGTGAADEFFRQLNKRLGYDVPPKSVGERAVEFGANAVSYPIANAVTEAIPKGVRGMLGLNARDKARQEAAAKMGEKLEKLPDLHEHVAGVADQMLTGAEKGVQRAEKAVRQTAKERTANAPGGMIAGSAPSDIELAARAKSLGVSGALRARDVKPIEQLYQKVQGDLGAEYEQLLVPHLKEETPETALLSLSEKATGLQEDSKQYALPGHLKGLIDKAAAWGKPPEPAAGTLGPAQVAALKKQGYTDDVIARLQTASGGAGGGAPVEETAPPPKWEELKKLRDELRPYFDSKHPPSRTAARILDSAVTDAYSEGGLPIDPELNMRYRDWRQRWTPQAIRVLHGARTPEQLTRIVNEDTMGPLLHSGDPTARQAVASVVARTIAHEQLTPEQIIQRFSGRVLRDVFGPGADDVTKWAALDYRTAQIQDLVKAAPELGNELSASINQSVRAAKAKGEQQIKKAALTFLRGLGEPAKAARLQVASMSPEKATEYYLNVMTKPEFADQMLAGARGGVPKPELKMRHIGLGSLPFAVGLGAQELYQHGQITSPYVVAVPFAIGVGGAAFLTRRALVRLVESDGMAAATKALDRAWSPATRRPAVKLLGKRLGQIAVSDAFRAALSQGGDDEAQPEPLGQTAAGMR